MKKTNKNEVAILLTAIATTSVISTTFTNSLANKEMESIKNKHNMEKKEYEYEIRKNKEIIDGINKNLDEVKNELKEIKEKNKKLTDELSSIVNMELTYYTDLPQENGGYTTTAIQTRLRHGVVASNYYPIGTKMIIEGTVYTVEDTGSSSFDSPHRLDVLIERKHGETDGQYLERVNNMGRKKVKVKIIN